MAHPIARLGGVFVSRVARRMPEGHRHPELECNLLERGRARYVLGSRRYDLGPGSLLWLLPGQPHTLLEGSADLELTLVFAHQPVLRHLAQAGEPPWGPSPGLAEPCRVLSRQARAQVRPLLEAVQRQLQDPVLLELALAHVVAALWRAFQHAPVQTVWTDVHPAVAQAARLLADPEERSLAAIARRVGLSTSRLRHLFQAQTGTTLVGYRNRQRLERFCNHYVPQRRLTAQALAAGFGSYAQFHRVFTAIMGATPQTWCRDHPPS